MEDGGREARWGCDKISVIKGWLTFAREYSARLLRGSTAPFREERRGTALGTDLIVHPMSHSAFIYKTSPYLNTEQEHLK